MATQNTAPPAGSGGSENDTDVKGADDAESLAQARLRALLDRAVAAGLTWRTGRCAGCNRHIHETERYAPCLLKEPEGVVLYNLCGACHVRALHYRAMRRRLEGEARRALFRAGPDDVGGTA